MSFCVQLRNKMDAQYIISVKQNGRRLLDKEGMEYRLVKKREKKSYWECVNKKISNCCVTAVVDNVSEITKSINGTHTHDSDLVCKQMRKLEEQAIKSASRDFSAPRTCDQKTLADLTTVWTWQPVQFLYWISNCCMLYLGTLLMLCYVTTFNLLYVYNVINKKANIYLFFILSEVLVLNLFNFDKKKPY